MPKVRYCNYVARVNAWGGLYFVCPECGRSRVGQLSTPCNPR
jgi:hypothetical protein